MAEGTAFALDRNFHESNMTAVKDFRRNPLHETTAAKSTNEHEYYIRSLVECAAQACVNHRPSVFQKYGFLQGLACLGSRRKEPTEPRLRGFEHQEFEVFSVIMDWHTPLVIVVLTMSGLSTLTQVQRFVVINFVITKVKRSEASAYYHSSKERITTLHWIAMKLRESNVYTWFPW